MVNVFEDLSPQGI